MKHAYDVIVVGARCAGSPTAMLLARRGYKVLVVDRATFPSDTVSTHVVQPLAVEMLADWGLLERVVATGCPPIDTYTYDFGPFTIEGTPGTHEWPVAYSPRRTVLDAILVEAAWDAGATVREGFTVDAITIEDGRAVGIEGRDSDGRAVTERAEIVVGADGRFSRVAASVKAPSYHERAPLLAPYYAYFRDLPMNGRFETYVREGRGIAAAPTNDGLTLVIAGWPHRDFEQNRKDLDAHYYEVFESAPDFAARVRNAHRDSKLMGVPVSNYFRKPYGPGWALVGDAGYNKDPITAQGIYDAFVDAERCANAIDETFRGLRTFDDAMREYHRERDLEAMPMYEFTCELASLERPSPDKLAVLEAIARGPKEVQDGFARMNAGTISPADFFAPENVARIVEAAEYAGGATAPG